MTKNLGLKILSLAFAVLLWFFVVGEEKAEITISLPVELVNIPSNLVVSNDVPSSIDVRVYGPRSLIRAVATQGISKVIDLKGAVPGSFIVHITPDSIPLPAGVRVLRIHPQNIEVQLDHMLKKRVIVRPKVVGTPNRDFKVMRIEVKPREVLLAGPEHELEGLNEINTLPVEIEGLTTSIERSVALDLGKLHVSPMDIGTVRVSIEIAPIEGRRKITHIPVKILGQRKVKFWPNVISAILYGPKIGLRQLEPKDVLVEIDPRGIKPGHHKVKPNVTVPKGFKLEKLVPDKISMTVKGEPQKTEEVKEGVGK